MTPLAALRLQLEWGADEALEDAPVDRLAPRHLLGPREAAPAAPLRAAPAAALPFPPAGPPAGTPAFRARALAEAAGTREALRTALEGFEDCALRATATRLVFADGNPDAGLVFVGEAPGVEEDRSGLPFVGLSGKLFDRMAGSIGLDRDRFLVTNVIPWRPPGNRTPSDAEVAMCLPFLLRHLALLRPRRVVLLGGLATKAVTDNPAGIRRLRGRWQPVPIPGLAAPVPMLPTYHPAYLLRTPGAKRDSWADLIALRLALDEDARTGAA